MDVLKESQRVSQMTAIGRLGVAIKRITEKDEQIASLTRELEDARRQIRNLTLKLESRDST